MPASSSIKNQIDLDTFIVTSKLTRIPFLLPHLMHFLVFFAWSPRFCFMRSLTIGFAIYKLESGDVDVVVGFLDGPCERY